MESSSSNTPPPTHIRKPEVAAEATNHGLKLFEERNFTVACVWLREALDIMIENFGKMDLRCASAYYKYGLALLYKVPIPDDDPMRVVPKEADYLLDLGEGASIFHSAAIQTGVNRGDDLENLAAAKKQLNLAWIIVKEEEPHNSMDKVNILSAMGEVAFRKGEFDCYHLYTHALQILEQLVDLDDLRIAHLNFKICLWMEGRLMPDCAIKYCKKAISVVGTQLDWLLDEIKSARNSTSKTEATLSIGLDLKPL